MCFGTIPNLFFGVSCKQRVYHLLAPKVLIQYMYLIIRIE